MATPTLAKRTIRKAAAITPLVRRVQRGVAFDKIKTASDTSGARERLVEFAQYVDPNAADQYAARHLRYVAEKLEAVERGDIKRLIIQLPIRHWKSSLGSEKFPAWFIGRNPAKEMIAVSYAGDLPFQFSASIRSTIDSEAYKEVFPGVGFRLGSKRYDRWSLKGAYRHSYRAAGVGGAVIGMGADLMLIDDPSAGEEAIATEEARNKLWAWYQGKIRGRLNPGGAIVIIMSRWHEDDLVGRLLAAQESGGEKWEVVDLPAIALDDDSIGRTPGEALWPERYNLRELESLRSTVGGRVWSSQFQQRPRPDGGVILDSGKIVKLNDWDICLPWQKSDNVDARKIVRLVRYWDLAFSEAKGADAMAGVLCGVDAQRRFYILDVVHLRGRWPINKVKLIDTAILDNPAITQIVEANGTQLGYAQDIKDDHRMRGRLVRGFDPSQAGNKQTRASMWGSRLDDQIIHAGIGAWRALTFSQIDSFGAKGAHDDIVDGISGCWAALNRSDKGGLKSV